MSDMVYTRHAQTRTQQRAIRKADIRLIRKHGTMVDDDTWLLLRRDAIREIEIRKKEIQQLERLKNRKVVIREDWLVTAYPSRPADQKRALRRGRQKGYL